MSYRKLYLVAFSLVILALNGVNAESFSSKFNSYKDQVEKKVQEKLDSTSMDEKIKEEFTKKVQQFKRYIGEGNYQKAEEYLSVVKNYSEKLASLGIDYGKDIYGDLKEKYKNAKETKNYKKIDKEIKELKSKFLKAIKKEDFQKAKHYLNNIKEKTKDFGDESISYTNKFYKKLKSLYERKLESKKTNKAPDTIKKYDKKSMSSNEKFKKQELIKKIKGKAKNKDYLSKKVENRISKKLDNVQDNKKVKYYEKILDKIESKREILTKQIEKEVSNISNTNYYKKMFGVLNEVEKIVKDKLESQSKNNSVNSLVNNLFDI